MLQNSAGEKIILESIKNKISTKDELNQCKRTILSKTKLSAPTTAALRLAYLHLLKTKQIKPHPVLDALLCKRDVRTQSGVAIITVLTKPYPCPGQCVYCPTEVKMPKSYIASEPAAQRALFNKFDPFDQVVSRLTTLRRNGHPTDKIELIVKGGTWSAYRWDYQIWFIRRCFDAVNAFGGKNIHQPKNILPEAKTHVAINKIIKREELALLTAQNKNEQAKNRIIGLTLETRPDWINPHTVAQLRQLGCTRVELGLQHTDDKILEKIKRGHTLADTAQALTLLRAAGFKVDVHTMPQLPGSTPARDQKMYQTIFADPALRPDMIKIYPCVVVPSAELAGWFERGEYKPYSTQKLIEMLIAVKTKFIPRYCRISRLIRDIPGNEIIAGNKITNLRETIQKIMGQRGLACPCLRCREIGRVLKTGIIKSTSVGQVKLFIEPYRASLGTEYFLSFEDTRRRAVYAFARLYLPDKNNNPIIKKLQELLPETKTAAFVRELHTYGNLAALKTKSNRQQQHHSLGKQLMAAAEKIAQKNNYKKLAVISGIGVRGYYRHIGYRRRGSYMVKSL